MAKGKGKKKQAKRGDEREVRASRRSGVPDAGKARSTKRPAGEAGPPPKMRRREFEEALEPLQVELVKMQEWVKASGAKICVLFEGRDTAGKGGVIKRITERVSPRVFRVVALAAPTEREKSQMYYQRYLPHLPAAGEVVLFDRSWYNRAGVERVMGFATERQVEEFLKITPTIERAIVHSGVTLVKYWLEVDMEEQAKRFEERDTDPRKIWKLSPMDLEAQARWYDYSRARDAMFEATDTPESPWYVVPSNDQRRARLNCISHLLSLIPYEEVPRQPITFPKRQKRGDYRPTEHPFRYVPARY
ncbi:MAG: polyphosphate kinase 2 [Thermoanaerobaculales bacterium]|jgi:polyphosphate kinase 2|nr:polyphosphate kinase 2 [Thermoanaerobaculales bacterium]